MDQFIPTGAAPASVGVFLGKLWAHGEGTSSFDSQKNLVGTGAARPGPRTLLRKQVGHSLAVPSDPPPHHLPQILAPQGRTAIKNQQEGAFSQPLSWLLPFTYSMDKFRGPQSPKIMSYV